MNTFKFTGNLVRAPYVGETKPKQGKGRKYVLFTVANNDNGSGNFVSFKAYGAIADAIEGISVGTAIGLIGHIRESSVKQEGKKDASGKDVYTTYRELVVERFGILERQEKTITASAEEFSSDVSF